MLPAWRSRERCGPTCENSHRLPLSGEAVRMMCALIVALQLVALVPGIRGEVFAVGGPAGWTVPFKGRINYTEWIAMLDGLNVGDTLLFSYPSGEHNVLQVGEEDFKRCRSSSPTAKFTDGQTMVKLPKAGRYWFICGFKGHCNQGQKIMVEVPSFHTAPAPAPSPAARVSSPADAPFFPPVPAGLAPEATAEPPSSSAPPDYYRRTAAHPPIVLLLSLLPLVLHTCCAL